MRKDHGSSVHTYCYREGYSELRQWRLYEGGREGRKEESQSVSKSIGEEVKSVPKFSFLKDEEALFEAPFQHLVLNEIVCMLLKNVNVWSSDLEPHLPLYFPPSIEGARQLKPSQKAAGGGGLKWGREGRERGGGGEMDTKYFDTFGPFQGNFPFGQERLRWSTDKQE